MQTRLVVFCAVLMLCFGLSFGQMIIRSSDNSELMRVTEAGRVGIGTSSPGARVEIDSRTNNSSGLRFSQLNAASSTSPSNSKVLTVDAQGDVILVPDAVGTGDGNNYTTGISYSGSDPKTLTLNRSGMADLTAQFNDDDQPDNDAEVPDNLSINNGCLFAPSGAGFVGIGTIIPGAQLEVDAGAPNTSGVRFTRLTAASPPSPINNLALSIDPIGNVILVPNPPALGDNLGNHVAIQNLQMSGFWVSNDGGNEGIWVDAVGKVGVNVQGPATDLHIFNNSATAIPELLIQQAGPGIAALNYAIPPQSVTSGIDPGDLNCYKMTGIAGFAANTYKDPLTLTRIQTAQNLFGIMDINHQSRADGWLSFMQLVPPVWTQIMFDQTLYDEHLEFNTAAPSSFTALQEGYYQVEARTEFNLLETEQPQWLPNCFVEIAIRVNNQPFANGNRLAVTDANAVPLFYNNAPVVTRVVHLLPGQSVSIWVLHNLIAPVLLMPGSVETYVSVHKIS